MCYYMFFVKENGKQNLLTNNNSKHLINVFDQQSCGLVMKDLMSSLCSSGLSKGIPGKKVAMCAADMKPGQILVDVVWFLDCRGLCVWCLGVVHCHRALQSWSSRFLS